MRSVDVWVARLDGPPTAEAGLSSADLSPAGLSSADLSPAEHARAARYRFADDARRFAAARGWLRRILGAELGVAAADVAFSEEPGKPRLAGEAGPCFNLSHAGELAVIAVAGFEVGVDIEALRSGPAALDAARLACTPAEAAALARLPAGSRADAFLGLWTAKEAYLKGLGVGLSVAPDSFEVADAGSAGWCIRPLLPAPGYVGAVAGEGPDFSVELRPASGLTP